MGYKEGILDYSDGMSVRYRINDYLNRPVVVFIHGMGERLEMYDYMYPYFDQNGFALNAVELRGHGLSGGVPRHIDDFEDYIKDLRRFIFGNLENREVYLMGFSTGCTVITRLAQDERFNVKGLICVSPLWDLKIPKWQKTLMPIISKVFRMHYDPATKEDFDNCTHDPEMSKLLYEEALRTIPGTTIGFVGAFFRERKKILKFGNTLTNIPLFLMLGEEDNLTDTKSAQKMAEMFYEGTENLTIQWLKNNLHSILLEKNRIDNLQKILKWLAKQENHKK